MDGNFRSDTQGKWHFRWRLSLLTAISNIGDRWDNHSPRFNGIRWQREIRMRCSGEIKKRGTGVSWKPSNKPYTWTPIHDWKSKHFQQVFWGWAGLGYHWLVMKETWLFRWWDGVLHPLSCCLDVPTGLYLLEQWWLVSLGLYIYMKRPRRWGYLEIISAAHRRGYRVITLFTCS